MGGVFAGTAALATAKRGSAETEEGLRMDVREVTDEYIATEVAFPSDTFDEIEFPDETYLGLADRFVIHDDGEWVSVPEEAEGLARPAHAERVNERGEWPARYVLYFPVASVDEFPEAHEDGVRLGIGAFPERTVPGDQWDTAACPGHRDY